MAEAAQAPYCFVSYSSREPHARTFVDCLQIVFGSKVKVECTPSTFESGASQRDQITSLIKGCQFGVVLLDGLRPNVVFEYGVMHGYGRPVLLFKEKEAEVDILGFFGTPVQIGVASPPVNCDTQFSNVKDVNYALWERFNLQQTVKLIWDEYRKKKDVIAGYIEIEEPKLW
jgi:hypothetical protein